MTFLGFTGLVNFLSSGALAVLVYRKCPRRELGVAYALVNISVAAYSAFYFLWQCSTTPVWGLLNLRLLTFCAMWINQALLYFNVVFFGWSPFRRRVLWLAGLGNLFFSILNFTRFMYWDVAPRGNLGFWPVAVTGWFTAYLLFWHGELICAFGDMIYSRRDLQGDRREQVTYMIAAFAIGYIGGISNWPMWYGIPIPPYLNILISAYILLMAYAILRHQLMDITIVLKKTLLYSFASTGLASVYVGLITLLARLMENHPAAPTLHPADVAHWLSKSLRVAFPYSCVALSFFSFGLGLFVWAKGHRQAINRLWGLTCLAIGLWSLGYGVLLNTSSRAIAHWWLIHIHYFGALLIPVFFFHFVTLVVDRRYSALLATGYALTVLCEVLNFSGILAGLWENTEFFRFYPKPLNAAYFIFLGLFVFYPVFGDILLWREMRRTSGLRRNQMKWIFWGTSVGFCGGANTFFMAYGLPIFPFGVYVVPIYIITVSYAIYRHQLMDINVVIRTTLLYSLVSAALASIYVGTITLLVQVLGSRHGPASVFSSALAAIFITLLFNPLRIRIQRWIDSRFPREHLDPDLLQEAAGGFAHEMKRPLSKISLPAQLLLMELGHVKSGEETWEEFLPILEQRLQFIVSQSIDAGYVIEAIRELSAPALPFEPVVVRDILDGALAANKDLLEKHGISVLLQIPKGLPQVSGRAKQLEIVFVNLIKNGAEAMKDLPAGKKGELRIEGRFDHAHVIVRVADTGPGIRPGDNEKLFSARYTTKGRGGAGLGLYLSRQIIQGHGGAIEASSQPGCGTVFIVKLPTR